MKMKVLAILQARMRSTRLPNKVLLPLEGRPVLHHVINRARESRLVSDLVVATTVNGQDKAIADACKSIGANVFRGSEADVLDRFYQAAKLSRPDHIVRVTSDCPLLDPKIIDLVAKRHLKEDAEYTSNIHPPTFPDGEDIEVFTFGALEKAWKNARLSSEREHVTPYIYNNPGLFKISNVENSNDLSKKRWTLDEKQDYEFIKQVYKGLYAVNPLFGMKEILGFLAKHPEFERINAGIGRNKGYAKSLQEDKVAKQG